MTTEITIKLNSRPAAEGVELLAKALKDASAASQQADKATKGYVQEVEKAATKTRATKAAVDAVTDSVERQTGRLRDASGRFVTAGQAAQDAGGKMRTAATSIDAVTEAVDRQGNRLRDAGGKFTAAGNSAEEFGRQSSESFGGAESSLNGLIARAAALAAGFVTLRGSLDAFTGFERTLAQVGSVAGASASELEKLQAAALEAGSTTEFTAREAGEGLLLLARAGFSARQSIQALPGVLNLAVADAVALGEAADIAGAALNIFGLEASELTRVADVLVQTSNKSNTGVRQLGEALSYVGPIASATGLSIEETAAVVGQLGNAGIQASRAGTALSNIIRGLSSVTADGANALRRMGLTTQDVSLRSNTLVEVFRKLGAAQLDVVDAEDLFGAYGQAAALALSKNADNVERLIAANRESQGVAEAAAKAVGDNLTGSYRSLSSAIEGAQIDIVDGIAPALRSLTDGAREAVVDIFDLEAKTEQLGVVSGVTTAAVASLAAGIGAAGLAKSALLAGSALKGVSVFLAANPFAAGLVGVSALTAGVLALANAFDEVDRREADNKLLLEATKDTSRELGKAASSIELALGTGDQSQATQQLENLIALVERLKTQTAGVDSLTLPDFGKLTSDLDTAGFLSKLETEVEIRLARAVLSGTARLGEDGAAKFREAFAALGDQFKFSPEFDALLGELAAAREAVRKELGGFTDAEDLRNLEQRYREVELRVAKAVRGGVSLAALDGGSIGQALDSIIADFQRRIDSAGSEVASNRPNREQADAQTAVADAIAKARQELEDYEDAMRREIELLQLGDRERAIATAQYESMAKAQGLNTTAMAQAVSTAGALAARLFDVRTEQENARRESAAAAALERQRSEAIERARLSLDENLATIEEEIRLAKLSNRERFIEIELLRARAAFEGQTNEDDEAKLAGLRERLNALADEDIASRGAEALSRAFGQAFADIVTGAGEVEDVLRNLFGGLANQLISGLASQALRGAFQGTALASFFGAGVASANGNLFGASGVQSLPSYTSAKQFAGGGLFPGPTLLPIGGGQAGLFGEAGIELAVPAVRNRRGQVSVSIADSIGAIAKQLAPNITIVNNFTGSGQSAPRSTTGAAGLGMSERQMLNNALRRAAI